MKTLRTNWRLALASAAAAALVAACGGGESESAAPGGPQAAEQQSDAPARAALKQESAAASGSPQAAQRRFEERKIYIVQMAEPPAVAAVKPADRGSRADRRAERRQFKAERKRYAESLKARHDEVLASVGSATKLHSYGHVFNGFAASLTDAQVAKLAAMRGVISVTRDEIRKMDTSSTHEFLGLSGKQGVWKRPGATGEGVVIGIVDSGVWPESLSFTDRANIKGIPGTGASYKVVYGPAPSGWSGTCQTGKKFDTSNCNNKLIGARYFNAAWGGDPAIKAEFPDEYASPRDGDGHGTHTASTAGGNANVPVSGPATPLGAISGVAPRARIASYKVCWGGDAGGCATSDSVAAIDQAVEDGVDVINFSISGSRTSFRDPVEIAFLFAADAGVFVAASAGNSGPTASTVAHGSPWITTVAAGTHNRLSTGLVTLGNNATYSGVSVSAKSVAKSTFIDAAVAGLPGSNPTFAARCYGAIDNGGQPVLDPKKVAGKIVLCDRGVTARVNKSLAVKEAGGLGTVLVNVSAGSLDADYHVIPTVHLAHTHRAALKAYAATPNAKAAIAKTVTDYNAAAPFISGFSSRGPMLAGSGDVLKPDIIAPGSSVLAAVAPPFNSDRSFDLYSGTSMSSPHIAGIAALIRQLRPGWSPMAIKSAMMTTAYDVLDGPSATAPGVLFGQGAGHVKPSAAFNPGLVFDSNWYDWIDFLCGQGLDAGTCSALGGTPGKAAYDMNTPSIAFGGLPGVQVATRRVTNVSSTASTYTPTVTGMAGLDVTVSPPSLHLAPGQTGEFTVTMATNTAPLLAYVGGYLTWNDTVHSVRIPMVARPVGLGAPLEASGSYAVKFGFDGTLTTSVRGLLASTVNTAPIVTNQTLTYNVVVPAGTTYARFSTFDSDHPAAGTDIDLEVYLGGTLVGSSGTATSEEGVSLTNPAAGTYEVRVIGYSVPPSTTAKLHHWVLGTTDAGNMTATVSGPSVKGQSGTINIGTSGLLYGTRYLGSVAYGGSEGLPSPTIIRIDIAPCTEGGCLVRNPGTPAKHN